jgi:protein-tyrosine phosphatase
MENAMGVVHFNFSPACEKDNIVFGSCKPGYLQGSPTINGWITAMQKRGIERVMCLLNKKELNVYKGNLINDYRNRFGEDNVINVGIENREAPKLDMLINRILPFLDESVLLNRKTVVHCHAGIGRTGIILASWNIYHHGLCVDEAVSAVKAFEGVLRNPYEAGQESVQPLLEEIYQLRKGK